MGIQRQIIMRIRRWGIVLVLGMSACTVGPNYTPPKVAVPKQYKEGPKTQLTHKKEWKPMQPQDAVQRGAWWTVFRDPVLNHLEEQLNTYNQTIKQQEANYQQALAVVDQARAGFFPTLSGSASLFRQKQGGGTTSFINTSGGNTSTSIATSNSTLAISPTNTVYSSALFASWEPDIWGMTRRTVEASVAQAQANKALVGVTKLSAQGALAQYYFELRIVDLDKRLLAESVKSYEQILRFTQRQYRAGVLAQADVLQAQSQLDNAKSQWLNSGILRGQYEHAIAVLIGCLPEDLVIAPQRTAFYVPTIPFNVPSLLLERRPDVAQAERMVQNASALIGVAVATFYPNIVLNGSVTASAKSLGRLIRTPVLGWSTGLQIAETFFDGWYRRATVRSAKANYTAQVAAYRQVVLSAFQEVEDNLVALRLLKEQVKVQEHAAMQARMALRLTLNQYKAGTVAYLNVLVAQTNAYNAQKAANDTKGLELSAAVGLIKALGGSWHTNN